MATAKPAKRSPKPTASKRAAKSSEPSKQLAPRQGFEAGSELEQGLAVGPPSGIELAASIAGLLGEAAQAGLSSGGRVLKDTLSRLPGL